MGRRWTVTSALSGGTPRKVAAKNCPKVKGGCPEATIIFFPWPSEGRRQHMRIFHLLLLLHQSSKSWRGFIDNTDVRLVPGSCTVQYKQLNMCTWCVHVVPTVVSK